MSECAKCQYQNTAGYLQPCVSCSNNHVFGEDASIKQDMFKPAASENVNHPTHYNRDGALECIDEMILMFGREATATFCALNAWKYRYRAGDKGGEEDLQKSDWYIAKYKELKENRI